MYKPTVWPNNYKERFEGRAVAVVRDTKSGGSIRYQLAEPYREGGRVRYRILIDLGEHRCLEEAIAHHRQHLLHLLALQKGHDSYGCYYPLARIWWHRQRLERLYAVRKTLQAADVRPIPPLPSVCPKGELTIDEQNRLGELFSTLDDHDVRHLSAYLSIGYREAVRLRDRYTGWRGASARH